MSRAFVKEDTDLPERSGRARSASGLPPGALNYITAAGERRLRERLVQLQGGAAGDSEEIAHLEGILASVTAIEIPATPPDSVAFGAIVTVRDADESLVCYRIVGVDEVDFYRGAVSWISPLGKALLGAEVGERVRAEGDRRTMMIMRIEYGGPTE
jgi:transcription elongation GreA/GreB family factor